MNILVSLNTRFIFKRFSTFFTFKLFCVLPNIIKLHYFFWFELFPINFAVRRSTSFFMLVFSFYLFKWLSTNFSGWYFNLLFSDLLNSSGKMKTYRFLGLEHYCSRLKKIFHYFFKDFKNFENSHRLFICRHFSPLLTQFTWCFSRRLSLLLIGQVLK